MIELVEITPERAAVLLRRYTPNARPLNVAAVDKFADSLRERGKRFVDIPAIQVVIGADGFTTAGQHLLYAIMETGISTEVLVQDLSRP